MDQQIDQFQHRLQLVEEDLERLRAEVHADLHKIHDCLTAQIEEAINAGKH